MPPNKFEVMRRSTMDNNTFKMWFLWKTTSYRQLPTPRARIYTGAGKIFRCTYKTKHGIKSKTRFMEYLERNREDDERGM